MQIPLFKPYITNQHKKAVAKAMNGSLSRGPILYDFESAFADYVGRRYAVATSSGTAGLHIALKCLDLKEKSQVLTTPFSFIATPNVLLYESLTPTFADISLEHENLSTESIIKYRKGSNVQASLLCHMSGNAIPYTPELRKYQSTTIEDACQSLFHADESDVGKHGIMQIYGFANNKLLTTAEGGIVTTDDQGLYQQLCSLRDQGRSTHKDWLNHVQLGYSYRMSELHAALGLSQLQGLSEIIHKRKKHITQYAKMLKNIDGICIPPRLAQRSPFTFQIRLANSRVRQKLFTFLASYNIQTRATLPALHLFPEYQKLGYKKGDFPNAEKICEQTLSLPLFLKKHEIKYICQKITDFMGQKELD